MLTTNVSQTHSPVRIDGINILRGLSIFFVLMNHVNMRLFLAKAPYTAHWPAQLASSLVWNGQRGVQIFFCISGFLIASTSIRRWGSLLQMRAGAFYVLRFARIVPLLGALLAILSLLHLCGVPGFVVSDRSGGLSGALVAALTFRVNVLEAHLGYLPACWDILWSLSVEETFYLFFPVVCIFLGRTRWLYGLLAIFVALGPFGRTVFAQGNEVWAEVSYLGSMDAIALGVLTALVTSRVQFSRTMLKWLAILGGLVLMVTLGLTRTLNHWGLNAVGMDMTLLAIGTCLLIVAAAQSRWQAPRFLYPLLKLGERSYEIYLTHMFVIIALYQVFVRLGSPLEWVPALFLVSIVVSALLGEAVSRWFSEPMNTWLRMRMRSKREGQPEPNRIPWTQSAWRGDING